MVHPPNRFLAQYLVDIGAAVFPHQLGPGVWPVVYGNLPDGPANYLGVQNYGARPDGRLHTGERPVHHRCQILIRSTEPQVGFIKGQSIQALLDKVGTFPQHGGVWTQSVTIEDETFGNETIILESLGVVTPVSFIGQETGNQRWLHALHVQMEIYP